MSLRTRLIIAFLLLSVVPLTAVTLFSYTSSVNALESAARREASEGAADISRRMEMITADVGRRVDRIFEDPAGGRTLATTGEMRDRVAPALGDTAALVEKLEFEPVDDPDPDPDPDSDPEPDAVPRPPAPPVPSHGKLPEHP